MTSEAAFGAELYAEEAGGVPAGALAASLGRGVPTAVADLHPGEVVLDLGSGAGADVLNTASLALHHAASFCDVGIRRRLGRMSHGPQAGQWRDVVLVESTVGSWRDEVSRLARPGRPSRERADRARRCRVP